MPRKNEPRVMVRLTDQDFAAIKAAADSANVAVGALVRQCAVQYASRVARQVADGDVRLRQQRVPERPKAAAKAAPVDPRAPLADAAERRIAHLRSIGAI